MQRQKQRATIDGLNMNFPPTPLETGLQSPFPRWGEWLGVGKLVQGVFSILDPVYEVGDEDLLLFSNLSKT